MWASVTDGGSTALASSTVKHGPGCHHYGRSTATYCHKTIFPITFSRLRHYNERSPLNPATGQFFSAKNPFLTWYTATMCDNFYNPRKNLFTNTDDAIFIRDYFSSGRCQSNSQISTLQILTIMLPGEYIQTLCSGQRYSAGDIC